MAFLYMLCSTWFCIFLHSLRISVYISTTGDKTQLCRRAKTKWDGDKTEKKVNASSGQKCKPNGAHETINHFACNFAKCLPILKIRSPADWMINVQQSKSSHLKCLLHCDLSLIRPTIRHFSEIHILQGSVATWWWNILAWVCCKIYRRVCPWNNCENRLTFGEVMGKSLVFWFFTHGV